MPTVNFALLCKRTENHPVNGVHDEDVMNEILFLRDGFIKSYLENVPNLYLKRGDLCAAVECMCHRIS